MKAVIETIAGQYDLFHSGGMLMGMFLACLLYVTADKKNRQLGLVLSGYTLVFTVICFFPVTAYIIMKFCIGELVYWRMFWLLPLGLVIAYAFVRFWEQIEKKVYQWLFVAGAIAAVSLSGVCIYSPENFVDVGNPYKLPPQVIQVCDFINQDAGEQGIEKKKLVVPIELTSYVRQYDAGMYMPYGRNALKGEKVGKNARRIYEAVFLDSYNWPEFLPLLKKEGCNYFVCRSGRAEVQDLKKYGFQKAGEAGGYEIFRWKKGNP